MSEVLIKTNGRASGNLVVIRPSGWVWGKKETFPNFTILEMDDVAASSLMKYQERGSGNFLGPSGKSYKARRWLFDIHSLSGDIKKKALGTDKDETGRIIIGSGISKTEDITWKNFRYIIYDKINMKTEEQNKFDIKTERDNKEGGK